MVQRPDGSCATICEILWTQNFETDFQPASTQEQASANANTTKGKFQHYLEPISANRAFVRNVKSFLCINILGESEISESGGYDPLHDDAIEESGSSNAGPEAALNTFLSRIGRTFDEVMTSLIESGGEHWEEAKKWKNIGDVPQEKIIEILTAAKNLKASK